MFSLVVVICRNNNKRFPNSKFVCIQRDKKETINSFLKIKGNEKEGA